MKSLTEIFNSKEERCILISAGQYDRLVKSEERLQIVKDFVKSDKYLDRETLLILLGEKPESTEAK